MCVKKYYQTVPASLGPRTGTQKRNLAHTLFFDSFLSLCLVPILACKMKIVYQAVVASLLLAGIQAKTPDNVSSRLMIHVSDGYHA